MKTYIRRNEAVEAFAFMDEEAPEWFCNSDCVAVKESRHEPRTFHVRIQNDSRWKKLTPGDYVVKDLDGKIYVYSQESFAEIFDGHNHDFRPTRLMPPLELLPTLGLTRNHTVMEYIRFYTPRVKNVLGKDVV